MALLITSKTILALETVLNWKRICQWQMQSVPPPTSTIQFNNFSLPHRLLIVTQSNIKSPEPHRMKYHVKHIISLGRRVNLEMPPYLRHSPLLPYVLPRRDASEYPLQIWDHPHQNLDQERSPVQDVAEWGHIVVRDQHRHTSHVDSLHSRARNLVATWANAELALSHHVIVRHASREVPMDVHVLLLVFPVLEENGPDGPVKPAREECQY